MKHFIVRETLEIRLVDLKLCNKWSWRNETTKTCFSMGFPTSTTSLFSWRKPRFWLTVLGHYAQTVRSFKWISPARRKPKISNWTGSLSDVFSPCWAGKLSAGPYLGGIHLGPAGTSFVAGIRIIDDELCIFRMFQVLWQMFIFVLSSRLC